MPQHCPILLLIPGKIKIVEGNQNNINKNSLYKHETCLTFKRKYDCDSMMVKVLSVFSSGVWKN